jgi:small neutral amino acid transporter SnatA (MarC family)
MDFIKPILRILFNVFIIWGMINLILTVTKKISRRDIRVLIRVACIILFLVLQWYLYGDNFCELVK